MNSGVPQAAKRDFIVRKATMQARHRVMDQPTRGRREWRGIGGMGTSINVANLNVPNLGGIFAKVKINDRDLWRGMIDILCDWLLVAETAQEFSYHMLRLSMPIAD